MQRPVEPRRWDELGPEQTHEERIQEAFTRSTLLNNRTPEPNWTIVQKIWTEMENERGGVKIDQLEFKTGIKIIKRSDIFPPGFTHSIRRELIDEDD